MTLALFLVVAFGAAGLGLLVRSRVVLGATVGVGGLVLLAIAAAALRPGESLVVADSRLIVSEYTRLFLVLGSVVGLGLGVSGLVVGSSRDAPAATLAILGACALTLGLTDARAAVLAGTLTGLFGVVVTLTPAGGRPGSIVGIREVRAVVVAGTMAIAATAWFGRDLSQLAAQPVVFGLAYLAFAVAVAIRFGAIPFHLWAARLADAVPDTALPVLTALAPSAFAVVALAWIDGSVAPLLVDLDVVRDLILLIAIASIVLAALAAFMQDDLEHVVGYSIVGDAGVVILALAVLDPAGWAPARIWLMAFVVGRAAFGAWAAGVRVAYSTGRIDHLRGWATRSPILAVALVLVAVAAVGFPGLLAFDSRAALVDLALGAPLAAVVLVATLLPVLYYGRLFVVGLSRPEPIEPRSTVGVTAPRTPIAGRPFAAAVIALLLSGVALSTAAGAFGLGDAAAAVPSTVNGPVQPVEP
jgi:NADH:ubiquinone oxidoreductase subunit 5 (subunit L)/multisubunit Na+/H+ antiporter MnhA subunit